MKKRKKYVVMVSPVSSVSLESSSLEEVMGYFNDHYGDYDVVIYEGKELVALREYNPVSEELGPWVEFDPGLAEKLSNILVAD